MSPLYVRPYVKVHKTDDREAEAIAEAATRPMMPFVALKSQELLDLQALHRARERLVQNRTRLVNQARGFLMERGIRIGAGRHVFQRELRRLLDDDGQCLMSGMVHMLSEMAVELDGVVKQLMLDTRGVSVRASEHDHHRRFARHPQFVDDLCHQAQHTARPLEFVERSPHHIEMVEKVWMDRIRLFEFAAAFFVCAALREIVRAFTVQLGELLQRFVPMHVLVAGDSPAPTPH